jgi:hypothetical protein
LQSITGRAKALVELFRNARRHCPLWLADVLEKLETRQDRALHGDRVVQGRARGTLSGVFGASTPSMWMRWPWISTVSSSVVERLSHHSVNYLVGTGDDRWRHGEAERPGRVEVDDELESSRLLDRQISGLGSFQDLVDIPRSLAINSSDTWSITDQAAGRRKLSKLIYRRDGTGLRLSDFSGR